MSASVRISRRRRSCSSTGFTLLELLVAMAVFSILSITAYNGLRNFITAQAILEDSEAEFSTIQKAVTTIERDLKSAITRSIRDELGDDVAAMRLAPDNALELTRKRPGVPIEFNLVDMVRVDYVIVDGILSRRVWDVLDRVPETGYEETVLLSDLDDVSWSFYRNGWVEFWPLANDPFSQSRLPRAVKFTLSFADGRTIDRIIMIDHQG